MKIQLIFILLFLSIASFSQISSLKDVVTLTLNNSKEIEEAKIIVEHSQNDLKKAESLKNPNISLKLFAAPIWKTTGSIEEYENDYSKWGIFSGGEISIIKPLFAWNIEKNLISSAKSGLTVAKIKSVEKTNIVIKQVIDLYFNHLLSSKLLDLINENQSKLEKVENYLEKNASSSEQLKFKIKKATIDEKTLGAKLAKDLTEKAIAFYTKTSAPLNFDTSSNLSIMNFISDDLNSYINLSNKNNFSLNKLNAGIDAKSQLLAAEKKKKYPLLFASAMTDFKYSNVKDKQTNPWRHDPYNSFGFGAFIGIKLNFDTSQISTNEKKAILEQKELLIKKAYAEIGTNLQVEKAFNEFLYQKNVVELSKKTMKYAKRLFMKEALKFELKKKNGKELLEAMLEKFLAIKNYYTAVTNCNNKYFELLDTCGQDLSELKIY